MNKKFSAVILGFALLLLFTTVISAKDLDNPDQVDIYPEGVDATWTLAAEAEMELILPSSFDSNQIRYQVREGAVVKQLEADYEPANGWVAPAVSEFQAEIEQIEQEIRTSQIELSGIEQTIAYLADGFHYTQLDDPLDYFRNAQSLRTELEYEKQELLLAKREAEQKLRNLNQQLMMRFGGDSDNVLKIKLNTNGVGYVDLLVYSRHASWEPFYRLSLDSDKEMVTLDSYITVQQRTGIDFTGLVRTHTGAPVDEIGVPHPTPLVARILEPQSNHVALRSDTMQMDMTKESSKAAPEMLQVDGPVGVTFVGEGNIPSDNQWVSLSIASEQLPVNVFPTLIPYESEEAWILAESKHPVAPLLAGAAELIVDGSLTGQSQLSHIGGDDLLALAFGRSPLIKANRQPIVYTESQTWLGRNIRRDGYTIEVTNGSFQAANIEVVDRIPVAGHDRLNISTEISPEPCENADGLLTWQLSLEPGESQTISVKYEIQYPDGMDLVIQ